MDDRIGGELRDVYKGSEANFQLKSLAPGQSYRLGVKDLHVLCRCMCVYIVHVHVCAGVLCVQCHLEVREHGRMKLCVRLHPQYHTHQVMCVSLAR